MQYGTKTLFQYSLLHIQPLMKTFLIKALCTLDLTSITIYLEQESPQPLKFQLQIYFIATHYLRYSFSKNSHQHRISRETHHTSPRAQIKGPSPNKNPSKSQHPRINSLFVHPRCHRLNCHVGILVAVSSLSLAHSPTENYPLLSAFGGLEITSCSIQSSDIAHHHVAIGAIALVSSSLYTSTLRGLAHKLRTTSPTHSRNDTST